MLITMGFTPQQNRTIKGKVTSAGDGIGIPGVNVFVKGTKNGTTTDADGKYSINVSAHGGTLVFSFVGFETKEVKIKSSPVIDLFLSPYVTFFKEFFT